MSDHDQVEALEVVIDELRHIRGKLAAVFDRDYHNDPVQAALDIVVTNDLPFLIGYLESWTKARR
ncbi:MAG TPA: hypothetical protein VEF89_13030 [Solirubrobacteraceae bacterium]|nr:hypothetical protein [Solirubrobacteraceae bacterium]